MAEPSAGTSPPGPGPGSQPAAPTLAITVNGQPRGIEAGATLADLLARLEMDPRRVAVERNLDVVPRKRYTETVLCDGDKLEIVTFVGGGA